MAPAGLKEVVVAAVLLLQVWVWHVSGQQPVSTCRLCERRPSSCRRIAGLYTVTVLTKGTYNPVVEIPPEACSINITELAPSQNYLAVTTDRGENVVNGRWSIGSTGRYPGVGTEFLYNRGVASCPGECITAIGPTTRPITVQLLFYDKNPGIAYSFVLPKDVPFRPFDQAASKAESRPRSHNTPGTHRSRHNRQRAGTALDPEPYTGGGRQSAVTSQVQEPRGQVTSQRRRTIPATSTSRGAVDGQSRANTYRGSSYGSHTLGGRGQSYTYQYTDSNNNPIVDGSRDSSSSSSISGQYVPSRGSASRSRLSYDPSRGRGNVYGSTSSISSRRRPTYARRPFVRREQSPSWRQPQTPNYISAYDSSGSRGYQTLASSSGRGGLVDQTFSRSLEAENNRLQTFERPVARRPALSIGTGGSGNDYEWTISGLTECSRSCGGGTQETEVVCVLTSSGTQVVVTSDNCQNALKPRVQRVSCNNDPCPPGWVTGDWSDCSVTCGGGTQTRRIECRQRFSTTLELSVSASQCHQAHKPAVAQQCNNEPCTRWKEGPWGECSADCGGGQRERVVECVDGQGVQIPAAYCSEEKPAVKEECNTQSCSTQWWHTHWSEQCSADCGSGVTTRQVICVDRTGRPVSETACKSDQRPRDRKRCESSVACGSLWFTGAWSQCSDSCGQGVRTRQVVCMKREGRGSLTAVEEDQCPADRKPSTEEACFSTACGAQYYMGVWSQCSVTCGSGVRTRDVRCLDENQQQSWSCDRSRAPSDRESCELSPCRQRQELRERPSQTSRSLITAQGPQSPNAVYVEAEEEEEEVEEEEEEEKEEEDRFGGNVIISNRIDNSNTGSSNKFDDKNVEDSNIKNDDDDDDNSNANIATTTTTNNNNNVNKEDNGRKNSVVERMPADPKAIDGNCKNTFWNCRIVVQARLCPYKYYKKVCCAACRRVV